MKKKLIIGGVILAVLLAGGFAVRKFLGSPAQPAMAPMPTVKVEKGLVEKVVFAKGVIAEARREEVKAEVKAGVTEVAVKEGDTVKAGDLLFAMDAGDSKLALEQEELSYQMKAGELAKALAAADSEIVRSPVTGKVVKVLIKEGDKVEDSTQVAEVSDPSVLEVVAPFGPMDIKRIEVGQKAKVFPQENWGFLDGRVTRVDKQGKPDRGGGLVHNVTVRFANPGAVLPGKSASLEVLPGDGSNIPALDWGEIREAEVIKVKAGATGRVIKIDVREGDNVNKNALLARLDITDGKLALSDRRLALRQAELAREIKLKALSRYRVYATQDGIVSEVNVVKGQEPPMDKPAVVISGVQGLELVAKVEEADIPYLRMGQEAAVYANAFGERLFPGVITEIARQGKTEGSAVVFETKVKIKDPGPLRVGMTGDVDIQVAKKNGVMRLPLTAVNIEGRKGTVMVTGKLETTPPGSKQADPQSADPQSANQQGSAPQGGPGAASPAAVPREVKLGLEGDEFIEITGGLKVGEEVLLNPNVAQPAAGF